MITYRFISFHRKVLFCLLCAILLTGCAILGKPATSEPGTTSGYLERDTLPDSSTLLPPPPDKNSAAMAYDNEVNKKVQKLRGTARWEMAIRDANLNFPEAAQTFSCALNAPITEQDTPQLYLILRRSMVDAVISTFSAKFKYKRKRPFVVKKQSTCTPDDEAILGSNGSYPSGHTAIGWAWALILSELAPERADAIIARGRAYGESRIICNVHWYSDVVWGRFMGAATVAKLHADSTFRADLEAARNELEVIWAKGLKPTCDCEAENHTLAY